MLGRRSGHQHLIRAHPWQDSGADAHHGIGAIGTRVIDNAFQSLVTRFVEDIGIFRDFAAHQLFERTHYIAADPG